MGRVCPRTFLEIENSNNQARPSIFGTFKWKFLCFFCEAEFGSYDLWRVNMQIIFEAI